MVRLCYVSKFVKLFKAKPLVNVIHLDGVIGSVNFKQGLSLLSLNKTLEEAFEGKNLQAVALNINSPGGSPVQSELISKRISQLSKQKNIPVIAFVEDMAASGGYWIACAASEIIVAENALLGSLGVLFSSFGLNKAIEKLGVERRVHTQGESKAILDPFLPEKKEDVEMILKVQADIYANFKRHVYKARENKLNLAEQEIFSGAIWSGNQAITVGLADKIGDLYSELQIRFGDEVNIKILGQQKSWLKKKLGIVSESICQSIYSVVLNMIEKKFELR
jgi:signal peptide peptidase SppA